MTEYDRSVRDGCLFAGLAALVGLNAIFFWPLALGMLLFIGGAVLVARYWQPASVPLEERPEPSLGRSLTPLDSHQLPASRIRAGIFGTIRKHQSHPVIQALGNDILQEADHLCNEALRLAASRSRTVGLLANREAKEAALAEARMRTENESDPQVREALAAAVERRRADLENLGQIEIHVRLWDALLEQAEATLSELQSKLTLTLSDTADPARQQLALAEASQAVRTLSETLSRTALEVEDLNTSVSLTP